MQGWEVGRYFVLESGNAFCFRNDADALRCPFYTPIGCQTLISFPLASPKTRSLRIESTRQIIFIHPNTSQMSLGLWLFFCGWLRV